MGKEEKGGEIKEREGDETAKKKKKTYTGVSRASISFRAPGDVQVGAAIGGREHHWEGRRKVWRTTEAIVLTAGIFIFGLVRVVKNRFSHTTGSRLVGVRRPRTERRQSTLAVFR